MFGEARAWIERLERDAHYARTPEIRAEKQESISILRGLLESSTAGSYAPVQLPTREQQIDAGARALHRYGQYVTPYEALELHHEAWRTQAACVLDAVAALPAGMNGAAS
ncbi:hypothetical protein [Leucobacter sp. cx-169]|uniref:hypothetical protein n=1 Tax=Leucobacter sp. cx-169 TaxID=2770549 RepID=UPI00165D4590|nr:hypothetical protein [Leucobacter sp. cx-169]MBC9927199.1 hypothetical protein [Leucobacter sp. cx-169]